MLFYTYTFRSIALVLIPGVTYDFGSDVSAKTFNRLALSILVFRLYRDINLFGEFLAVCAVIVVLEKRTGLFLEESYGVTKFGVYNALLNFGRLLAVFAAVDLFV
jgi:hypothetical protein